MAPPANKTKPKICRPSKITTQTLLDFDLEESSSDSDFRIEDHDQESDDDFSDNSNAADSGKDDDDDEDDDDEDDESDSDEDSKSDFSDFKATLLGKQKAAKQAVPSGGAAIPAPKPFSLKDCLIDKPICCACLGDRSDDTNEIVECDGCGVSVHEGCYGVSDSTSVSSTISSCSTEPWFCEACKAGISEPTCELCPNSGGIFKETDVGRWVHLICALYVPGVAFGEVDQLSAVTLFEMPYSKWGAKTCSLCEDAQFARTGVCIGCDAGMCKTYFHVTCAQAAGLLSEAHSEEADHADPFYAHCKIHSDKTMIKHRKRNYNTLKMQMEQKKLQKTEKREEKPSAEQLRIQRKLSKHQSKFKTGKVLKTEPWVPTQKMPRLLTTSATACKRLMLKAELMGIDTAALEFQEAQMAALADVRKKWHIPPAFTVEFIGYYLDRISRLKNLKSTLERSAETNKQLLDEQESLRDEYDQVMKQHNETISKNAKLKDRISELHKQILSLCPTKILPEVSNIGQPVAAVQSPQPSAPSTRPMSVPTAAALKMGVGFPLTNLPGKKDDKGRILSTQRVANDELVNECGICKRCHDQHMLAKCDTCHFYYHLGCLNPPLTRHPKKSKLYGWQCSECDKSDDSDAAIDMPKGPRKSRTRFSKDGTIVPVDPNLSTSSNDGNNSLKVDQIPAKRKPSTEKAPVKAKVSQSTSTSENVAQKKDMSTMTKAPSSPSKLIKKAKLSSPVKKTEASDEPSSKKEAAIEVKDIKTRAEKITSPKRNEAKTEPLVKPTPTEIDSKKEAILKSAKKAKKDSQERDPLAIDGELLSDAVAIEPPKIETDEALKKEEQSDDKSVTTEQSTDHSHKLNRKRRKEKHKNKYSSDNEKSPTKEHKRKRKKKSYDIENIVAIPKIKIKFKTLPLPGEIAPEPHCFYVSADMVRPQDTSRPTSVETVEETTMNADDLRHSFSPNDSKSSSTPIANKSAVDPLAQMSRGGRISSPRKPTKRNSTSNCPADSLICDVCHEPGTPQNLVKCDECLKNYHFTCLDPPLKKTPKRRGYSWHCADCDPTDVETDLGVK